jgi:NAD(P)-dependent dehydrogenase (short-subunit alcohol dehydrogenase family)
MQLEGKHVVVTGGASGIGRALVRRFAAEGARGVVVADLDAAGCEKVAAEVGGTAVATDVADPAQVKALVARAEEAHGPVDLFCSNAGIATPGGVEAPDADWERIWKINVMSHVYGARAVLPSMLARGEGYLLNTASAAGLLNQIGSAPYGVTKHAAVGLAEWLAITYGDRGITVSVLCPQAVRTAMTDAGSEVGDAGVGAGPPAPQGEPHGGAHAPVGGRRAAADRMRTHPAGHNENKQNDQHNQHRRTRKRRVQQRLGFVGAIPD